MQALERRRREGEPAEFGLAQPQPVAEALRVLDDRDAERRQTQERVGLRLTGQFDRDEPREATGKGHDADKRLEESGFAHDAHDLVRTRLNQQFEKLVAHPFARQPIHAGPAAHAGRQALAIDRAPAEAGGEAEEAQNAQGILADARVGVADEAHPAGGQILQPAEDIMHAAVGREGERVDGEIPPARVRREVASEGDFGVASVRLDVLAQGGRLDSLAVHEERDRAVGEPGQGDLEFRRLGAPDYFPGSAVVARSKSLALSPRTRSRTAPPDKPGLLAAAVQRGDRPRQRAARQRREVLEPTSLQTAKARHSIRPGTSFPFCSCAGT